MNTQEKNKTSTFASVVTGTVGLFFLAGIAGNAWAADPLFSSSGWGSTSGPKGSADFQLAERLLRDSPEIQKFLSNPSNELQVDQLVDTKGHRTFKFKHSYKGLEVLGSLAAVDVAPVRQIRDQLVRFDLDTTPTLSSQAVASLAQNLKNEKHSLLSQPELKILASEDSTSARLIYSVALDHSAKDGGYDLMIDAHSGAMIAEIPDWHTIAPVEVYDEADSSPAGSGGAPLYVRLDKMKHVVQNGKPTNEASESALRAAKNATQTLEYFLDTHDRRSFDNKNTASRNVVHIGENFSNAFWSSRHQIMAYGDGDGVRFDDFTKGVDVAGHEMTHGVVSETAGLLYFGESGALNEALADFFGKMVENKGSWILGQELFLNPTEGANGLRNIEDPHKGRQISYRKDDGTVERRPYPKHMRERFVAKGECSDLNDYCWVHVNSTIPAHALYQIHLRIGQDRTEALTYQILTRYLKQTSGFRDFKNSMVSACDTMFDSYTCRDVKAGLAIVGL